MKGIKSCFNDPQSPTILNNFESEGILLDSSHDKINSNLNDYEIINKTNSREFSKNQNNIQFSDNQKVRSSISVSNNQYQEDPNIAKSTSFKEKLSQTLQGKGYKIKYIKDFSNNKKPEKIIFNRDENTNVHLKTKTMNTLQSQHIQTTHNSINSYDCKNNQKAFNYQSTSTIQSPSNQISRKNSKNMNSSSHNTSIIKSSNQVANKTSSKDVKEEKSNYFSSTNEKTFFQTENLSPMDMIKNKMKKVNHVINIKNVLPAKTSSQENILDNKQMNNHSHNTKGSKDNLLANNKSQTGMNNLSKSNSQNINLYYPQKNIENSTSTQSHTSIFHNPPNNNSIPSQSNKQLLKQLLNGRKRSSNCDVSNSNINIGHSNSKITLNASKSIDKGKKKASDTIQLDSKKVVTLKKPK